MSPASRLAASWLAVLACSSSGVTGTDARGEVDYGIGIFNAGSARIYEAQVSYASYRSRPTSPGPKRSTGEALIEEPVPEIARVTWKSADGTEHRREVEVLDHMPDGFEGKILFEIGDGDEVRVRFQPWLGLGL